VIRSIAINQDRALWSPSALHRLTDARAEAVERDADRPVGLPTISQQRIPELLDAIQLIAGLQLDLQCHSHCRTGRCGRPYEAQVPALIRLIAISLPEPKTVNPVVK
jgi:hypothetical protein